MPYPYYRKPDRPKFIATQYPYVSPPNVKLPSISIDPPVDLPEGRDSGVSHPAPERTRPDRTIPRSEQSMPPIPDRVIPRVPSRQPVPGPDDYYPPMQDSYPPMPPVQDTYPTRWPVDTYPPLPEYEPIDDYYPEPEIIRQQPPPYESDTFIHNGQEYQCEWVYCCKPVGAKMPDKLEPNANETYSDIIIWQDDSFPEYTIDKCNNALGFCMSTRESTFSVIGRIIYPKDITAEIKREIEVCLRQAAIAALAVLYAQIQAMNAVPESIPAVIPTMLKTAFIAGKEAFFECIRTKASYKYLMGKLRFTVFHDQTSNEGWRRMNEQDVLKLIEKMYMYSSGLIYLPGVGSFDDLANKIGINKVDLEGIFRNAGKSVSEVADKLKERAKGFGEDLEGIRDRLPSAPVVPNIKFP